VPLIKIARRVTYFRRHIFAMRKTADCYFCIFLPWLSSYYFHTESHQSANSNQRVVYRCISNLFNIVRTNVNELHIVRKDSTRRDSKKLCVPDKRVRIRLIVSLHRPRAGIFSRFARLQPDVPPRRGIYRILHRIGER